MNVRSVVSIVLLSSCLMGCASQTHLTRTKEHDNARLTFIDAKQRAVISSKVSDQNHWWREDADGTVTNGVATSAYVKFCAEPSPDALSAIAASFGLSFSKPEAVDLAQSFSLAEGAGSIGLRTQSIQLMRDAMYRLCEASINDELNSIALQTLMRRLHSSMVVILAIEQLTGVAKAPPIYLGGQAVSGAPELISKLTEETETARKAMSDAAANEASAKKVLDEKTAELKTHTDQKAVLEAITANGGTLTAAQTAELKKLDDELIPQAISAKAKAEADHSAAKATSGTRQEEFAAYDSARKKAIASGAGSATVEVSVGPLGIMPSKSAQEIAQSVTAIVKDTLQLNFAQEFCVSLMSVIEFNEVPLANSPAAKCMDLITAQSEKQKAEAAQKTSVSNLITHCSENAANCSSTTIEALSESIVKD